MGNCDFFSCVGTFWKVEKRRQLHELNIFNIEWEWRDCSLGTSGELWMENVDYDGKKENFWHVGVFEMLKIVPRVNWMSQTWNILNGLGFYTIISKLKTDLHTTKKTFFFNLLKATIQSHRECFISIVVVYKGKILETLPLSEYVSI